MSTEITLIRTGSGLVPATDADRELLTQSYKIGQPVRTICKRGNNRSLQHHKLYFGGLIGLVKDYWEPQTGLVNRVEVNTAASFCTYLQRKGIKLTDEQSKALQQDYLQDLSNRRAAKLINPIPASTNEIHKWLKNECGYFDVVRLPNGDLEKRPKSINFATMGQTEFNEFYKAAFGVCWRFVLSRHFDNEADAQNVINRMLDMAA